MELWNGAELARGLGVSGHTVRGYLDLLTGIYLVRQLQPWFANVSKRQYKAPKVYLRDSGRLRDGRDRPAESPCDRDWRLVCAGLTEPAQFAPRRKSWENAPMRPSEALATRRDHVIGIAAARGARSVRVFGSVVKGLDRDGSDLDLLVDLPPGTSLLNIVGLQLEIEDALGVKVDLCTERELHPALKERILAEARPL